MLYLLSFYLPRFLDCPFDEKLATVLHELWHVSPHFNGDLRRHGGRCYAHGSSRRRFDAIAERLADRYLNQEPPREAYAFLYRNFRQLTRQYGRVYGIRIPAPKLIPATSAPPGPGPRLTDVDRSGRRQYRPGQRPT
jgi:hypothetical protein